MMAAIIRPYQSADRGALLEIGAETAFFGAPIESYMEDRRIFMDAFYRYYTDYEPEHAWVASDDGVVVGFLTGCINGQRHAQATRLKILPLLLKNWLRGIYHPGRKTYRYALAVALAALRKEIPSADERRYPAHLHINLLPEARGKGLGKALLAAYLSQLRGLGIVGVHLHTTSQNAAACQLYERMGFSLLASRPTRMYAHLIDAPVENRLYGQALDAVD